MAKLAKMFKELVGWQEAHRFERQREGIAKAKSAGKYKGIKPIAPEQQQHVLRLAAEGATKASIARQLGIGEATVYRILGVAKE